MTFARDRVLRGNETTEPQSANLRIAPGTPGIPPTWTSSAKDMVGCSLGTSRLWFTLGFGIVNEVYYPRVDIPQIRDLGFIVAGRRRVLVRGKAQRRTTSSACWRRACRRSRSCTSMRVIRCACASPPIPRRDVLAIECRLDGDAELGLYVLLAPHLGATGYGNTATVASIAAGACYGPSRGRLAWRLAAVDENQRDAFGRASAGYVGTSDGWQDFARNGAMTWQYDLAGPGNVALIGELPRQAVLALGFGSSAEAAATLGDLEPVAALRQYPSAADRRLGGMAGATQRALGRAARCPCTRSPTSSWSRRSCCAPISTRPIRARWWRASACRGATAATSAAAIIWSGRATLVECAGALLALGAEQEARDTLRYLIATQTPDGHWHQNQWLGGTPYWQGIQLDETAFPVLLAAAPRRA